MVITPEQMSSPEAVLNLIAEREAAHRKSQKFLRAYYRVLACEMPGEDKEDEEDEEE